MPDRENQEIEKRETGKYLVYEPPRVLFREPLEGVAAACTPSPPGKADLVNCGQGQS